MARAYSLLPVSNKKAVEICNFIRNMSLVRAKKTLEEVAEKKTAVPFKRYNRGIPHRTAIGPGKFPVKASENILKLLVSAEANAQFKGLSSTNLIIKYISTKKASTAMHPGRHRSRKIKRCYIEIVLSEAK